MSKIFIASAGNPRDRKDLDRSIISAVDRRVIIESFSDATYPELIDIERRGRGFYAWGVRAGGENLQNWFQMGIGDFLLLTYKDTFQHYAKVLGRYENARAAQAIWGKEDTDVREFLFFLSEPINLSASCKDLSDYLPANFSEFEQVSTEVLDRIEGDFGSIERFIRRRLLNTGAGGPVVDMSGIIKLGEREQQRLQSFDAPSSKEARAAIVETIVKRRGHPEFRRKLLAAYENQCPITSCNTQDALEACYIVPYRGKFTQHASNGILLRADLHTLFDLGKFAIDTRTMTIIISDELRDSSYRILAGRPLRYPKDEPERPSVEGLDLHRQLAGL